MKKPLLKGPYFSFNMLLYKKGVYNTRITYTYGHVRFYPSSARTLEKDSKRWTSYRVERQNPMSGQNFLGFPSFAYDSLRSHVNSRDFNSRDLKSLKWT